jgi:probable F420-dependent oxidoreductase
MRFILHYPETHGTDGDMLDAGPIGEVAAAAEAAGFEGISLTEHPAPGANWLENGGHQSLDPFVGLAFAAAATSRLKLLTYLTVAPYRNPLLLAKTVATLDKLSGGRAVLGMGVGYLKSEYFALGVDFDERNALFDEALEALPLHWKGEPFSYEGLHFNARNVIARPKPVQDPIPMWIGGNSKLSRRRAATKAQGWMPMAGPPELSTTARTVAITSNDQLAEMIAEVQAATAEAGRPPLDILHSHSEGDDIAALEAIGVTWVAISPRTNDPAKVLDFISAFSSEHMG